MWLSIGTASADRRYVANVERIKPMRKIALLAAAAIGSSLLAAAPSVAQPQLQLGIGPDGRPQLGVRDPQQEEREQWRERRAAERAYEDGRRDARRDERRYGVNEERCRNVTIEEQDRRGRTITRRVQRCD